MLQRKIWRPIAWLILLIQVGLEAMAGYFIAQLNILPMKYLLAVFGLLAVMALITVVLLFAGMKHGPSMARRIRRIVAVILAVVMGVSSLIASRVLFKVDHTVKRVTRPAETLEAMVGVYVRADDPAQTIEDAADYSFGIMGDFDQETTAAAVKKLESELGRELTTVSRPSAIENAQALYSGAVKAMVMNESYASILEETEDYASFHTETRLLYEIPVDASMLEALTRDSSGLAAPKKPIAGVPSDNGVKDITADSFVLYLSGSDTRSAILDTSRSDVNILMIVNPQSRQILLLNTPRDYYVPNPAGDGALDKLTHCGIYGVSCSMGALSGLYETDVNYYGQINFTGFETLIDSIGGVTVESPESFESSGFSFVEGPNDLNGEQALTFARERYAFAAGDNMRGQNQMRVITAVIQKMTSGDPNVLFGYSGILDSLGGMFKTSMTAGDISALVKQQISRGESWNIRSFAVTGTGGSETTYSAPGSAAYVMYPDEAVVARARDLINKVKSGQVITDADLQTSAVDGDAADTADES